ncbi:transcription factor LHW isoform X1 [Canna indica]|uniref:Transcription factor LHW isoform X1 n=1 Tax=Canna indica TaxID=4628 RepID=A0AAQ3JMX0_9LILI|nr:transcription factor LHW isoform X1 [Canna indica]
MVGSGGDGRSSKEAVGMLALHEALRNVCLSSDDWTYSVFWTIRPRPYFAAPILPSSVFSLYPSRVTCPTVFVRIGGAEEAMAARMLMWEDGFCRPRVEDIGGEDAVQKAFSKMSIQLYNYGEGLMGKVASDKCHKWVFKEPSECEPNLSNYWQSSFDAIPPEWNDQFASGIQTIAVIQAGHGLLQLGSCKIIPEDLHFVLRMRYMFESLGYQSGFFLSQLFSSTRNTSPSSSSAPMKQIQPPIFNLSHHPLTPIPPHTYHPAAQIGLPSNKDDTQLFLPSHSSQGQMDAMMAEHEADLKWPNGMSFLSALTGNGGNSSAAALNLNADDFLSSDCNAGKGKRIENSKFKRSFTMPARMAVSTSSTTMEQYHASTPQPMDYRSSEAGVYQDIMETFLD